jgi:hypothetical protein
MITAGLAWYSNRTAPGKNDYLRAFKNAIAHQLGLFVEKDPIPPWTFRRQKPTMHDKAMAPIKRRQKC